MKRNLLAAILLVLPAVAIWRLSQLHDIRFAAGYLAIISLVAFLAMRSDKRRAERQLQRRSERSLHLLELLGGWPGSYLAQRRFRHKTQKRSYRIVFWIIVVVYQVAAFEIATQALMTRYLVERI